MEESDMANIVDALQGAVRHAEGNPDAGTTTHVVDGGTTTTVVEPAFNVEILMRSGNRLILDRVEVLEVRGDHSNKVRYLRLKQAEDARSKLLVQTLDLSQIEAVVRLQTDEYDR